MYYCTLGLPFGWLFLVLHLNIAVFYHEKRELFIYLGLDYI